MKSTFIPLSVSLLLSSLSLTSAKRFDGSEADLVHQMSKFIPNLHSHLESKSKSSSTLQLQNNFFNLDSRYSGLDSSYLESLRDSDSQEDSTPTSTYSALPADVTASTFTQPLDHFDPNNNATFQQRFWFSTRYYKSPEKRKPGEIVPIFVLDSGETDAMGRLPYLDQGILDILTEATGGIGIILEVSHQHV